MRGDTRKPQEILSQEDVQYPGNTIVFLLPVVVPAGKLGREEGPRGVPSEDCLGYVRRERLRVRLPEDAGRTP